MKDGIILGGGGAGGVSSDEVTVTADKVLAGCTYVGADTNDEIGTGTMAVQSAISFSCATLSTSSIRISWTNPSRGPWEGVFIQMSTSGYPGTSGGSRVYTGVGNNPVAGAANHVDITGLELDTTYYFTCTSYVNALGWGTSHNISCATSGKKLFWNGTNYAGFVSGSASFAWTNDGTRIAFTNCGPMISMESSTMRLDLSKYSRVYMDIHPTNFKSFSGAGYYRAAVSVQGFVTSSTLLHQGAMYTSSDSSQMYTRQTIYCDISGWTTSNAYLRFQITEQTQKGNYSNITGYVYRIWLE